MSKKICGKDSIYSKLFFSICFYDTVLKKMILEVVNLKNISGKPMMGIIFQSAKLFSIREIRKGFFLKKIL